MRVDIRGRIEKIKLSKENAFLPLFEAIINSLQSIEELSEKKNSYIKIIIKRDLSQIVANQIENYVYPIESFIIEDNGVGFNDKNYESFETSDSTYKLSKGGKGIGRLLWLKAFDNIEIVSVYNDMDIMCRKFRFLIDRDPIQMESYNKVDEPLRTEVKLNGFKFPYSQKSNKSLENIGMKIIEHCLSYFLSEECPRITIEDDFGILDLNKLFKERISVNTEKEEFNIGDNKFYITHVKLFNSNEEKNRLHFCANNREVKSKNLDKSIANLSGEILTEDRGSFAYSAYISGEVLDKSVNDERTNFNLKSDSKDLLGDNISLDTLEKKSIDIIKKHLKDYLDPVGEKKKARIEQYIFKEKPQYRMVLKYKEEYLEEISPNIKDSDLEIELFKIQQQLNYEIKREGLELLNKEKIKSIMQVDEYKQKYIKYLERENELGKSSLAEYIVHRKVIIDLLDNALNIDENNRYALEEYIHNLIFPMRKISDDINYEQHNLWLIDERLSYHYYLASDIRMKDIDPINVDNKNRADILIMDKPVLITNEENKPYNTLTVIEFKRPMRDDYTDDDNPISQVIKYAMDIRKGAKKDKKGRQIAVSENTAFYLYIIADLTPRLIEQAEMASLTRTADGMGFFGYNGVKSVNAYIEIISYEKLLGDAQKKNRILFDKLFTPTL